MNIPNILTILRLVMVPSFILTYFSSWDYSLYISAVIFLLAGITDLLDGYIARRYNMITKWGTIMDPLADKLMSLSVLLALTVNSILPVWIVIVIGIKEFFMILGGIILYRKDMCVPSKPYGKIATFLFYISIITIEFINKNVGLFIIYITVFTTLFALYKYVENYLKVNRQNI